MDFIKALYCDVCKKEITNEQLFRLSLSFVEVTDEGKYLSSVWEDEEEVCVTYICDSCIKQVKGLSKEVYEYIDRVLI